MSAPLRVTTPPPAAPPSDIVNIEVDGKPCRARKAR